MKCFKVEYPIAIIFYNRPQKLEFLLERLSKFKICKVYFISDGPKNDNIVDKMANEKCKLLIDKYNFYSDCEKVYSDFNMGCGKRLKSGIDYFFRKEKFGFIFEDDIIPNEKFLFPALSEIEQHFENGITHINLFNPLQSKQNFTSNRFFFIWGWATWSSYWFADSFSSEISISKKWWNSFRKLLFPMNLRYLLPLIRVQYSCLDTWDLQYYYCQLKQSGKSYFYKSSQVENIGFDLNATHTKIKKKKIILKGEGDFMLTVNYFLDQL